MPLSGVPQGLPRREPRPHLRRTAEGARAFIFANYVDLNYEFLLLIFTTIYTYYYKFIIYYFINYRIGELS